MKRGTISKVLLYGVVLVAPLVLWLAAPGTQFNVSNQATFLNSLARASGILGITFFAGNLLLSGRYKFLDWAFEGLDKVYLVHRRTGVITFTLLCAHAFLITITPLLFSFEAFWRGLINFSDYALAAGRLGFGGFLIVILITLYFGRGMKYESLRGIHKLLGAFFFLGGLHAYLIPSDISFILPLRWYTLSLVVLALVSYVWRTIFASWLTKRIYCTVIGVHDLGGGVTEVVMRPQENSKIAFEAGQFIFVRFKQKSFPYEDHPFSLTSSTEEGVIRISAKGVGDFTRVLPQLKAGAEAHIQGPYGGFSFRKGSNKKQIWIAGGIGITPFMSAARTLRDRAGDSDIASYEIILFYSGQTAVDLVYEKELEDISKTISNLRVVPWVTEKQGFITVEAISKQVDIQDADIFVCGPKSMITQVTEDLKKKGIRPNRIHFELFKLL